MGGLQAFCLTPFDGGLNPLHVDRFIYLLILGDSSFLNTTKI